MVDLSAFGLKPQNLHALFASYGATTGVIYIRSFSSFCRSSSSNLGDWDFQIGCCFFSHELSFNNGSMISLTNEAIQLQRKHCNGFSILIGFSYCITVASSLFISFFQHIITSQILHFGPQNVSQCPKEW